MADSVKIRITGDSSGFEKTLSGIGSKTNSVFKGIMSAQLVTKGISLVTSGLRSAISTGMQFEAAMSQVQAISGATGDELLKLTETAKYYGETTKFSASQAAEALNYMALAGWNAQQSTEALGGVLNLAAASGMDLGAASDAVTDYLSAFGMEASQAGYMADLMAYAQSKANTSASMLADAYGNCASTMHSAGQDIETTTAMLMALANQGIKGSEAGTQMAAVMRDLTSKMNNGQIMIGRTAVSVTDAAGNFRDLNDIIMEVGKATEGMGTAEQSAALMTTFTARSVKAVQTLLNEGMDSVNSYEDALRDSTGTATQQAETMMDNLQGDVQIFRSALEGLQITASESTNGIARTLVQESTSILDAMNQAGKNGGIGGMADALLDQIPTILPKAINGIEKLLLGIGAKIPSLAKKLVTKIPGVLKGLLGSTIPTLTDVCFDSASSIIEGIISQLPELVPILAEGLGNMFVSALKGIGKLIGGATLGVHNALLEMGMIAPTAAEAWQKLVKEVDDKKALSIAGEVKANYSVDTTITVDDVKGKVLEAQTSIEEQLKDVTGIDASKLAEKIIAGQGTDVLVDALKSLGISDTKINEVVATITDAQAEIQAAIDGLGLTDDQSAGLAELVASGAGENEIEQYLKETCSVDNAAEVAATITGAQTTIEAAINGLDIETAITTKLEGMVENGASTNEIEAYLTSFGVDSQTAKDIAQSITVGGQDVSSAISGLGIDMTIASWLARAAASGDKALIESALMLMGLDDVDISSVLASYDSVRGQLTSGINAIFSGIEYTLTDGEADTPDQMNGLKAQVETWAQEAYNKINEWYTAELERLAKEHANGNTTAEEYNAQVAEVEATAGRLRAAVESNTAGATQFIEDMAGKSTQYVSEHLDELASLKVEAQNTAAEIDALSLSASQSNQYSVSRELTINGRTNDQKTQLEALKLTSAEYEQAVSEANNRYAETVANAREQLELGTIRESEYADIEAEAAKELATACELAGNAYNEMMEKVIAGIAKANPEFAEQIEGMKGLYDATNVVEEIRSGIQQAVDSLDPGEVLGSNLKGDALANYLNDTLGTNIDFSTLAEQINAQLGTDLTGESLMETINNALKSGDFGLIAEWGIALGADLNEAMGSALSTFAGDGNAAATIKAAVEQGFIQSVNGVDWTNVTTQAETLLNTALNSITPDLSQAKNTAGSEAQGVVDQMDKSSEALSIGSNVGSGFYNGLSRRLSSALSMVRRKVQAIIDVMASVPQVASPSKVTTRIGRFVGEGFEIGLTESLSDAVETARSITGEIVAATQINLRPGITANDLVGCFSSAAGSIADAESARPIYLNVNGRTLASVTAGDNFRAQNRYNRSIALGVGK